ncbi:hypothetical protein MRX96_019372 [Rhipicephalus microplus]
MPASALWGRAAHGRESPTHPAAPCNQRPPRGRRSKDKTAGHAPSPRLIAKCPLHGRRVASEAPRETTQSRAHDGWPLRYFTYHGRRAEEDLWLSGGTPPVCVLAMVVDGAVHFACSCYVQGNRRRVTPGWTLYGLRRLPMKRLYTLDVGLICCLNNREKSDHSDGGYIYLQGTERGGASGRPASAPLCSSCRLCGRAEAAAVDGAASFVLEPWCVERRRRRPLSAVPISRDDLLLLLLALPVQLPGWPPQWRYLYVRACVCDLVEGCVIVPSCVRVCVCWQCGSSYKLCAPSSLISEWVVGPTSRRTKHIWVRELQASALSGGFLLEATAVSDEGVLRTIIVFRTSGVTAQSAVPVTVVVSQLYTKDACTRATGRYPHSSLCMYGLYYSAPA